MAIENTGKEKLDGTRQSVLPAAPVDYSRRYQDDLNNLLRLYFTQVDGFTAALLDTQGTRYLSAPYGSFADTTDQPLVADTATVMKLNTTDFANGVSIVTSGGIPSRITVEKSGVYNFQWSGQFQNTDTQEHDASIWVRKNNVDVIGSTGLVGIPSSHGGSNGHIVAGWNFLFQLQANDYIELWWSSPSAAVSLQEYPVGTTPTRPSTSSLVATMTYVSRL